MKKENKIGVLRNKIEELEAKNIKYESILNNVKEVIFQTDAGGLWTYLNGPWEEVIGFSVEESLGNPFLNFVHPEDRTLNQQLFIPLIQRKKESCRHTIRYLTKDMGFRWIEVFARLTLDENDDIIGTSGTLTDVHERILMEQALKISSDHLTGAFGCYVSKAVVQEILSSKEEIKVGGVRKDITIMFVDIRGFTQLSEKMEPEDIVNILNDYLDLCSRAVYEYEGTIDKFIGDGVMSIFGAPCEQEDHPKRAVRAALQMQKESAKLAERLMERYGSSVSFGIGLNSGPAVVGNFGSHERLAYTAIGDTVNLAARLESNAKPGQILISKETYERIKGTFEVTPLDAIKVKGKEQFVEIYQVEGEK